MSLILLHRRIHKNWMHNLRLVPQQKRTFFQGAIKIGQGKGHFHLKVGFVQQASHKSNRQKTKITFLLNISHGFSEKHPLFKICTNIFIKMFLRNLHNFSCLYKHSTQKAELCILSSIHNKKEQHFSGRLFCCKSSAYKISVIERRWDAAQGFLFTLSVQFSSHK